MANNQLIYPAEIRYFLGYHFWQNAIKLLKYQIELKRKGHNHFKKFSMFYYEKLDPVASAIEEEDYFNQRVGSGLFYGLSKEYSILSYNVPKWNGVGLRSYKFISYPLRVLFYAIGLYIVKLSQEYLSEYLTNTRERIFSYYGGRLSFDKQELHPLNKKSVYFLEHYKDFARKVKQEKSGNLQNKFVIRFDIQNYYDDISIPILLNYLDKYVKSSTKQELKFDQTTKAQLISFFNYLAKGKSGIPQADNDIVSSFIGYLYLTFADMMIDDELNQDSQNILNHKIIRYMDDVYVSVEFIDTLEGHKRDRYAEELAFRIAEMLFNRLQLRLNVKTKLYRLDNPFDVDELLKSVKKVSPGNEIVEVDNEEGESPDSASESDEEKMDPNEIVALLFKVLEKLKTGRLNDKFERLDEEDLERLKDVYDRPIEQLLKKPENLNQIEEIFDENFDFDLVSITPTPIMIMILVSERATRFFREFLLAKEDLNTKDLSLILNFLCQIDFSDTELLEKVKASSHMSQIFQLFDTNELFISSPGYYALKDDQVLWLSDKNTVIEQVRLRVESEHKGNFSHALNHLLNEVQSIFYLSDPSVIDSEITDYRATRAQDFMNTRKVPNLVGLKIKNLFDRRNTTPVSHAGIENKVSWAVDTDEYKDYQSNVGECLKHIL
jgi:AbiA family abortive infection protein